MKAKGIVAALAAYAGLAFPGLPVAIMVGDLGVSKAHADGAQWTRGYPKRYRAIRVRGGYYSYVDRDVRGGDYAWINRMFTPMYGLQSPAGPFDTGFFFDPGLRPHWWNNAPYPN